MGRHLKRIRYINLYLLTVNQFIPLRIYVYTYIRMIIDYLVPLLPFPVSEGKENIIRHTCFVPKYQATLTVIRVKSLVLCFSTRKGRNKSLICTLCFVTEANAGKISVHDHLVMQVRGDLGIWPSLVLHSSILHTTPFIRSVKHTSTRILRRAWTFYPVGTFYRAGTFYTPPQFA